MKKFRFAYEFFERPEKVWDTEEIEKGRIAMKEVLSALRDLGQNIQFSLIVATFIAALVGFIPNYDRMIYSQTEPVEYLDAHNYTGYPAEDDVPELVSREEILKEGDSYTLVVDAETIKPLHIFLGLSEDTITKSAFVRFLNKDDNKKVYGQLFSVELENGDSMIVLLDDYAVKLPRSGTVKLPIGETKELLWSDAIEYLTDKYDFSEDELAYYVDMAGSWRKSDIAERIVTVRVSICMVVFIVVAVGAFFLFKKIDRKESEKMERERKEKELAYKQAMMKEGNDVYYF